MDFTFNKNSIFSRKFYLRKNLLIEEYINHNCYKTKQIHKENKIILWINTMSKAKYEVTQADQKIKVLMQVKDQHFQEDQNYQKRVASIELDFITNLYIIFIKY